ncbi:hypothetical protein ACWEFD_26435 [Streptomyces ardesiacus]|uniref:hypothetical protein n=1 Tax=unclassified Streptomyces TaxID=2593676 RepID=UPI0004CBA29E|nr:MULTISPECIES: hypothetical protein [unclassified Streptomyces]KOX50119.1 hypothetical protein ADL09_07560 [Streptomyces sp. NRRL F-7442]
MALMDFKTITVPDPPEVTVRAGTAPDGKLTLKLVDLRLSDVSFLPLSVAAVPVGILSMLLSKPTASAVREFFTDQTLDVPLPQPLGTSFPAGDTEVKVRLDQPELGSHNGMLMISGTPSVS